MTAVIQMLPEGQYSNKDLERLVIELRGVIHQQEVMHTAEAAAFLGIHEKSLFRLTDVPSHKIKGIGRVYLRSELIDFIKKH